MALQNTILRENNEYVDFVLLTMFIFSSGSATSW